VSRLPGTDDAWRTLLTEQIRQNGRRYYRIAHNVLREATAAEDVCQQAFLKAWHVRGQFTEIVALQAWLAKVVLNESLQIARRRQVERKAWQIQIRQPLPQPRAVCDAETGETLEEALMELPEMTRLVVVLRVMQGMSGNEVKDLIGRSAAEVSRRLHEGLEQLRRRLHGRRDQQMGEPAHEL